MLSITVISLIDILTFIIITIISHIIATTNMVIRIIIIGIRVNTSVSARRSNIIFRARFYLLF